MRLNWFSPLAPQRTDIAHYTARIAAALMERFEVEFWTDLEADPAGLPAGAVIRRFDPGMVGTREFNQSALRGINLYNLGNDSRFHSGIARVAQVVPGIVVLHDTRLHHFTFERSRQDPQPFSSYLAAAEALYGPEGLKAAEAIVAAQGFGIEDHVEAMPFAELYLDQALGALCHSRFAAAEIRARNDVPVLELPLPFQTLSEEGLVADRPFAPPWRLVMFGYINRNRRLESVIEALAIWKARGADFRFDLFGSLWDEPLIRDLVERRDLQDRVHIHGFAPEGELDAAVAQAHLAFNLRHPTMGEASGGILRAWTFATPAVVTDEGWYARLPYGAAVRIPAEGEVEALVGVLESLADHPEAYRRLGYASYEHLRREHTPERYAALLADALAEAPLLGRRIASRLMLERVAERTAGLDTASLMLGRGHQRTVQALRKPLSWEDRDMRPVMSLKAPVPIDWETEAELTHNNFLGLGRKESALVRWRIPVVQDGLFYDISDLMIFLWVHGFVSGIQRVQLELLAATLNDGPASGAFGAVEFAYSEFDRPWRLAPEGLRELLAYAQTGAVDLDQVHDIIDRMKAKARAFFPGEGSVYFAPGAFWAGCVAQGLSDTVRRYGARFGVLIHDIFPITLPDMSEERTVAAFESLLRDGLARWDFFVTNSLFTARELADYVREEAPWRETPILPVPLAHAYARVKSAAALPDGVGEGDFILCVGTIEPRKNHAALLQAWRDLRARQGPLPKLVLVGRAGWRSEPLVKALRRERKAAGDLVWLETVSDAELSLLYERCLFVVYPSLAEGWGLPVGEALAAGKVCVTSRRASLPEVGGRFVVYADPPDAERLAEAIGGLIASPRRRKALERKIATAFKPRTWRDVAEDLLKALAPDPAPEPTAGIADGDVLEIAS